MIFLWLAFNLICSALASDHYTFLVEAQSENCFYENVKEGTLVNFDHHVYEGGLLDIEIKVFKFTTQIHSRLYFEGQGESIYSFVADGDATYGFCFNNEMSRFTPKTVSFSLHLINPNSNKGKTPIESVISKIEVDFEKIERQQEQYRIREHMHRNVAEETNSRVSTWSLIESAVLALVCFGQVFYIRRLFSDNRR